MVSRRQTEKQFRKAVSISSLKYSKDVIAGTISPRMFAPNASTVA
jgi:hypothetical protein